MKTLSVPPSNVYLNRLALLLFIFGSVILSCRKDDSNTMTQEAEDGQYAMYYRILNFIETKNGIPITRPIISNRTTYSTTDILDYIEGAMNLQYTDSRLSWASYDVRTDTFTIPLAAGYASQQDLEDLFSEIEDTASVHFYGISEPDKFPKLYDATNLSSNLSLMTLSVTARVGKVHRDPTPFGPTDYWHAIHDGKCDNSSNSKTASSKIADALNDYYAPVGCVFFTQITTYNPDDLKNYGWGDINPNDSVSGDFINDFLTFRFYCYDPNELFDTDCDPTNDMPCGTWDEGYLGVTFNDIECLDPDEMNYYFSSIVSIYNNFLNAHYGKMHCGSDFYNSDDLGISCFGFYDYFWWGSIQFGTPNSCIESSFPTYLPICC